MTVSGLKIQYFLGYLLSNDLKNHLFASQLWKQDQQTHQGHLSIIPHEKKDYLGAFFPLQYPSLKNLKEESKKISYWLDQYCPEIKIDRFPIILFPKIFIG